MSHRTEGTSNDKEIEFEEYVSRYFKDLKDGRDRVEVSNRIFRCPYCYEYDKTQYAFPEIVKHASRIGRESKSASYKSRARHLGLERYLKRCLDKTNKTSESRTEHYQDENDVVTSREQEISSGRYLEHGIPSLKRSFECIKAEAIAELKTISGIEKGNEKKQTKEVGNLNALNMMDKQCEEIKKNLSWTEANLFNVRKQKEELEKAYNEELWMKVKQQSDELKLIYIGYEQTKSKLKAEQEYLKLYEKVLQEREYLNETERRRLDYLKEKNEKAVLEQKKTEECTMKLAEAQKKEKNQLRQQIIKLEKKLDEKHRLELEIEQLKGAVEVMKHFREDRDVILKIKSIEEDLKEKEEHLENLEDPNQTLVIKERKANENAQDARKELINKIGEGSVINGIEGDAPGTVRTPTASSGNDSQIRKPPAAPCRIAFKIGRPSATLSGKGSEIGRSSKDTFWTICNICNTRYEYLKVYLNHNLICRNCHQTFTAAEMGSPANFSMSSNSNFEESHSNINNQAPLSKPGFELQA